MRRGVLIACAIWALTPMLPALADVPFGARILASSEMFQVIEDGVTITCGRVSGRWLPGSLSSGRFLSFDQAIRNKRAALKTAGTKKKARLLASINELKTNKTAQSPTCRGGPPDDDSPTPRPTATPESTGNFDNAGNLTSRGKTAFGVPSSLTGNITTGRSKHASYACTSCHTEKTGTTFSELQAAIAGQSEMEFISDTATDGDLAHMIAYLNRFKFE